MLFKGKECLQQTSGSHVELTTGLQMFGLSTELITKRKLARLQINSSADVSSISASSEQICSDKALEFLYGGQFTFSFQLC